MSIFPRKIVGRSINCAHFSILGEGDRPEHSARCIFTSKPVENKPLPGSTTSAATSLKGKSKTRIDLRGRMSIHVEIQKFFQKSPTQNLYPLSNRHRRPRNASLQDHRDVHNRRGTAGTCRCSSPRTPRNCAVCTVRDCRDSRNHGSPPLCR